ncbi:MAG: tetratricopeptide repeat protein [Bacteroidia bacterium]
MQETPHLPEKTIAVLPFVNMSASEENEYFSDGITEEIINALAQIKSLKVTSRTSSFYFKNKQISITEIAKALSVSIILEGSVRLAANKMRITAQLIDVADDYHFWSETFDRAVDDIFAVQDEVSLLIADRLREHIGHFEIEDRLVYAPDIAVAVYQNYLRGRYQLMKLDLEGSLQGIEIFEEVIAAAPNFALPYLAINQGYAYLGTMGVLPASESFAKAKPFLDKALEIDANLPESQLNLAWIACWQSWDLERAYQHITKAIDLRPTDEMYLTMANFLTVEGKLEAAHTYIDKALQLDPLSGMNHHYKGFLYFLQERYEQAIPYLDRALSLKPDLPFPPLYKGECLLMMGREQESLAYFQRLPSDPKGSLTRLGGSTLAQIVLGQTTEAEVGIAQLNAALQSDAMGRALYFLILAHTLGGQFEEAIDLVERCVSYHLPLSLLLYTEPILKPLRTIKRFQKLMQEVLGERTNFETKGKRRYKKSLLSEKLIQQYRQQLEDLMQTEALYLDPALSIRGLAERMDIPPNHLSQLLNEGMGQNFSEYINHYRLKAFQTKVSDPSLRHLTILALAYESGFNSKTVFNTFFKKVMGITPRTYWKENNLN